jgi:hypothetical protein
MTIAKEFRGRCEEFPKNAANRAEFESAILGEIFATCTEFHLIDDDKTLHTFGFKDRSAMTLVDCKDLRFALLNVKEIKAIRKARHFTTKELEDIDLCFEANRVGRGPDDGPDQEALGSMGHSANEPESEGL